MHNILISLKLVSKLVSKHLYTYYSQLAMVAFRSQTFFYYTFLTGKYAS